MESDEATLQLPRTGRALGETVRILLKTNKTGKTTDAEIKTLIHQALVRREVVVQLLLDMKRLGHPSFQKVDEATMLRNASQLPENGIPPEVLTVIEHLDEEDKLQPQKAATPSDGRHEDLNKAGAVFAEQRARAVVAEGRSEDRDDQNAVDVAALNQLQDQLKFEGQRKATETLELRTGNVFVDQFQPLYFATAFCFCFKHGTACPDVHKIGATTAQRQQRRRARDPDAPEVKIHEWAAAMQRRTETQFRRDWTFGFTLWNYLFRTMVNLQRNTFMYAVPNEEAPGYRMLEAAEITKGMHEIQQALSNGKYHDLAHTLKPVNGDLSKVRYVPGLSPAAKKVRTR